MIALLDIKERLILLYSEEGINKIPFHQANVLIEYAGDEKITYVTHGMQTTAKKIVDVIASLGIHLPPVEKIPDYRYIHGTKEGTIYINEDLKFEGKYDCKLLDEDMGKIISAEPVLQKLIENKQIEIIGEIRKRKLQKELAEARTHQLAFRQKEEERMMKKEEGEEDKDMIVIDLTSDLQREDQETITSLLAQIEED